MVGLTVLSRRRSTSNARPQVDRIAQVTFPNAGPGIGPLPFNSIRMKIYLLWHSHLQETGEQDVKLLGVYSTEARARGRASAARELPGFRDAPDGFEVSEYEVDRDAWTEGFATFTWRE